MLKRPSPKTGKSLALVWAKVQGLVRMGRLAEARRLLQAIARVKGPYQARARMLLARLRLGAPSLPFRAEYSAKARGFMVKKSRGPRKAKKLFARPRQGRNPLPESTRVRSSPKPASAKPKAPPDTIKRIPHMDIPEGTRQPGESFSIDIYVDTKKARSGETSSAVVLERQARKLIYDIVVWIAGSSHFSIDQPGPRILKLDVREDQSKKLTFTVRVREQLGDPAGAVLFAYFSYNRRPSGQVSRVIRLAGSAGGPPKPPAGSLVLTPGAPTADITVEVTDPDKTAIHMMCNVTSALVPADKLAGPREWKLARRSDLLVKGFMKEFVDKRSNPAFSLTGAGTQLFKAAPKAFQDLYWQLIDAGTPPATILITSEEPNIPWELMVPWRIGKDGEEETHPALGVTYKVGRWISGKHRSPPVAIPLKDSFVIAPTYVAEPSPLRKSAEEVALVSKAVPGGVVHPTDLAGIRKALGTGGRSLVHFVCHGADADEESDVQAIYLDRGKERLTSLAVTAIPEMKSAFKKRPMVFLNACEVGRPKVSLTGIGGFAPAFLDLGAAAVIAPLWSVKDTIAYEVARRFYEATVAPPTGTARRGFADVMREIRALAYDATTGEDTYAAYCFYGDPNASAA